MAYSPEKSFSLFAPGLVKELPDFLVKQRWFGGKAWSIRSTQIIEAIPVPGCITSAYIVMVQVDYTAGHNETYALPLLAAPANWKGLPKTSGKPTPSLRIEIAAERNEAVLYDALWDREFAARLLAAIDSGLKIPGETGEIVAWHTGALRRLWDPAKSSLDPSLMQAEQSNTSVAYGDRLILKFFRRLEEGINPDLEVGAFLTEKARFVHTPPMAGAVEFHRPGAEPLTLAFLQGFVANQGDAWKHTLQGVRRYFARIAARPGRPDAPLVPRLSLLALSRATPPAGVPELLGTCLKDARLLGKRTAELHVALASDLTNPAFSPEAFSRAFQKDLSETMQNQAARVLQLLRYQVPDLRGELRREAQAVLDDEGEINNRFRSVAGGQISAMRTRIHGDYHLGQVLFTGSDFIIIDFEGEPARPLNERRAKRSPLQDVAGMLRSFHYAAYTGLQEQVAGTPVNSDRTAILERWAQFWYAWISAGFLKAYFETAGKEPFLPQTTQQLEVLLNAFLLEKAVYELGYELNNRPDWIRLPLQGILSLLGRSE